MLNKNNLAFFFLMISFAFSNNIFPANMVTASTNSNGLNKLLRFAVIVPSSDAGNLEEQNDLSSFKTSLSVAGIHFDEIQAQKITAPMLGNYDIAVLPQVSLKNLTKGQIDLIKESVHSGLKIVFDGESPLPEAFRIKLQAKPVIVKIARDLQFTNAPLYWQKPSSARLIDESSDSTYKPICIDDDSGAPMEIHMDYGKGSILFFATLFDPWSSKGYSRFPFLIETLENVFNYRPLAERKISAMYYDPGSRNYMDPQILADFWRKNGVQRVYAGAWYFFNDYTYDYSAFIKACHSKGILVYCWLELPMVNERFWNNHPEWREKTALLRDAHVDWRYLMNLADKNCRKAVMDEIRTLLISNDWDGVDLAELYFDSANGTREPDHFTPMNGLIRTNFKKQSGFDPLEIFNKDSKYYWEKNQVAWKTFAKFRRQLCNDLKKYFLDELALVRKDKKDFEIIITAIDASMAPELEDNISEDMKYLLALQAVYDLTLQAEDEWPFWPGKPERYDILGKNYRKTIHDLSRLEIDFNVVDNHKNGEGGIPSEKPTGEEMRQVTYNIDLNSVKPVYYAEDTLFEHDFQNINIVLARQTVMTQKATTNWIIETPKMITFHAGKNIRDTSLDNKPWNVGEEGDLIIPAGRHELKFTVAGLKTGTGMMNPRLTYISSELLNAAFKKDTIDFNYVESNSSCYALFNLPPDKILINGKLTDCETLTNNGNFSVKLPGGGKHSITISFKPVKNK